METYKKILSHLQKETHCTQKDIADELGPINRAVLLGYLRCLVDLGKIKSRDVGKAKIYYL